MIERFQRIKKYFEEKSRVKFKFNFGLQYFQQQSSQIYSQKVFLIEPTVENTSKVYVDAQFLILIAFIEGCETGMARNLTRLVPGTEYHFGPELFILVDGTNTSSKMNSKGHFYSRNQISQKSDNQETFSILTGACSFWSMNEI